MSLPAALSSPGPLYPLTPPAVARPVRLPVAPDVPATAEKAPCRSRAALMLAGFLVALTAVPLPVAHAREAALQRPPAVSKEYQVKAAFLFNFISYTSWPEKAFRDSKAPIVIAVIGKDPFGPVLDAIFRGERVRGRRVEILREATVPERPEGHLIFCSGLNEKERALVVKRCAKRPILLVGEADRFAEDGALINFYLHDEKKVRFEINPVAVSAAKLQISSELMKLARVVKPRKRR